MSLSRIPCCLPSCAHCRNRITNFEVFSVNCSNFFSNALSLPFTSPAFFTKFSLNSSLEYSFFATSLISAFRPSAIFNTPTSSCVRSRRLCVIPVAFRGICCSSPEKPLLIEENTRSCVSNLAVKISVCLKSAMVDCSAFNIFCNRSFFDPRGSPPLLDYRILVVRRRRRKIAACIKF